MKLFTKEVLSYLGHIAVGLITGVSFACIIIFAFTLSGKL
jgi:hypothetical protein